MQRRVLFIIQIGRSENQALFVKEFKRYSRLEFKDTVGYSKDAAGCMKYTVGYYILQNDKDRGGISDLKTNNTLSIKHSPI